VVEENKELYISVGDYQVEGKEKRMKGFRFTLCRSERLSNGHGEIGEVDILIFWRSE